MGEISQKLAGFLPPSRKNKEVWKDGAPPAGAKWWLLPLEVWPSLCHSPTRPEAPVYNVLGPNQASEGMTSVLDCS